MFLILFLFLFVFAFGEKCIAEFASFKICLTLIWLVNIQHIKSQYYKTNLLYNHSADLLDDVAEELRYLSITKAILG